MSMVIDIGGCIGVLRGKGRNDLGLERERKEGGLCGVKGEGGGGFGNKCWCGLGGRVFMGKRLYGRGGWKRGFEKGKEGGGREGGKGKK